MKKSRYTEVQVAYALRQAEAGTPLGCLPRPGHIGGNVLQLKEEIRRFGGQRGSPSCQLEEENARLKRVVADLTAGQEYFAGRYSKKGLTPTRR